ncbi:unannotated protein [freshwater metagenome]|uniref:Unannotated protein n=1 Tax=freshwater metagenome TaxID=449393 RepID=A0A6J7DZA3_9ZZZZ
MIYMKYTLVKGKEMKVKNNLSKKVITLSVAFALSSIGMVALSAPANALAAATHTVTFDAGGSAYNTLGASPTDFCGATSSLSSNVDFSGNVTKVVKAVNAANFAGTQIVTLAAGSVFTTGHHTISLKVNVPAGGADVMMKLPDGNTGWSLYKKVTAAAGTSTLTFDFDNPESAGAYTYQAEGSGAIATGTYRNIVIIFDPANALAVDDGGDAEWGSACEWGGGGATSEETYYIDELSYSSMDVFALDPVFGTPVGMKTGSEVGVIIPITNYHAEWAYTVSSSVGVASFVAPNVNVSGLADGESSTLTVTVTDGVDTSIATFKTGYTVPLVLSAAPTVTVDSAAKTITCNNAQFNKAPTDVAYFLYINRVLIGGKKSGSTKGLSYSNPGVSLSTDDATLTSATWASNPDWNAHSLARASCVAQNFLGTGQRVTKSSDLLTLTRTGKFVAKATWKGTVTSETPAGATMRLISPVLTKDADGKAVDYFDWTYNALDNDWAKYYGPKLAFIYKYITAGSTMTLKWHVTNTDTGAPLTNYPVSLVINKNYGGVENVSFTYQFSGETKSIPVSLSNGGSGETKLAGVTDSNGDVTFVITNSNTASSAEPTPAAMNAMQPTTVDNYHSQITLTAGLAQDKESIDLLEFHFIKP